MKEARAQIIFVVCFLIVWQIVYQMGAFNEVVFPSLQDIGQGLVDGFRDEELLSYTLYSMSLILKGLAIGIVLAFVFSSLSVISENFRAIYHLVVALCDLLPGVALLPLFIVWFGIGEMTTIIIMIHSVIWPMSRSIMDGYGSVSKIYIESGRNMGLRGLNLVRGVYLPAAFTHVLSGMRVGWARAWRGLISIEMIFGTTGTGAGIGWYIFMRRTNLDTAGVFASLIVIMIIGIVIEYGVFNTVERNTVKKWGMAR